MDSLLIEQDCIEVDCSLDHPPHQRAFGSPSVSVGGIGARETKLKALASIRVYRTQL